MAMKKRYVLSLLLLGGLLFSCRGRNRQEALLFDRVKHADVLPVVVFGGGVAGLTAANYTLQANIPCLLVEGGKPGGALAQSDSVRNWPGVINAPGHKIVDDLKAQVLAAGGSIVAEKLVSIDLSVWPYKAVLADALAPSREREISFLSAIIAMGAEPNYLGIPGERGEDGYWGKGVTNCAVCDGSLCKGKVVGIVGGGDAAMTEAGYLAGIARRVFVYVRKDTLRAKDTRKVAQVKSLSNVTFVYNTEVIDIVGDGQHLQSVKLLNNKTKQVQQQALDGLFLAIGSRPNTAAFVDQLAMDGAGYLIVDGRAAVSKPGIFAAGDIADPHYKQAVTSAGQGCVAALEAQAFLERAGYVRPVAQPVAAPPAEVEQVSKGNVDEPFGLVEKNDSFVLEITSSEQLQELVNNNELPVVVDIYANLCIPCQSMAPIVEKLARRYDREVIFAKLCMSKKNFDPQIVAKIVGLTTIDGVPTFVGLSKGEKVFDQIGEISYEAFETLVKKLL